LRSAVKPKRRKHGIKSLVMPPSICGDIIQTRRGLLALGWTATLLISVLAYCSTSLYILLINIRYNGFADRSSYENYDYNQRTLEEEDASGDSGSKDEEDHDDVYYYYPILVSVKSRSVTFAIVYMGALVMALSIFGTTAVFGCTSPSGTFIGPCFSGVSGGQKPIHLGLFIGLLFMFANLTLVFAVIFGEFWVEDYIDNNEKENMASYPVELAATAFSGLCLFLSVIYIIFTVLVFVYHDSLIEGEKDGNSKKIRGNTGFITTEPSY